MSRPRFLADEDLHGDIVRAVRRLSPTIEISTVVKEGWRSASDAEVLEAAWNDRWLLVSHDVNSLRAEAERRIVNGQGIHGLFLSAQHNTVRDVAKALVLIGEASEFDEWRDLVTFIPF